MPIDLFCQENSNYLNNATSCYKKSCERDKIIENFYLTFMDYLYIITYMNTHPKLTKKQEKFFNVLAGYMQREKRPPTHEEILKMMDLRSPRSVAQYLDALEEAGYIQRGQGARNIKIIKSPYYASH